MALGEDRLGTEEGVEHLEVIAGAPMRTPPGAIALTSPTTAFLLRVM